MVERRRKLRMMDVWSGARRSDPDFRFMMYTRPMHSLYSLGLRAAPEPITATASWLRIQVESQADVDERLTDSTYARIGPSACVDADQPPDNYGLGESIYTTRDDRVMAATAEDRPPLILDWLHTLMLGIAGERDWSTASLEFARNHCLQQQYRFGITSPAKSSPDRKHKATLTFTFDDEGNSLLRTIIVDRSGTEVTRTDVPAIVDVQEWPGVRNSLCWTSKTAVGFGALLSVFEVDLQGELSTEEIDVGPYLDLGVDVPFDDDPPDHPTGG